jgi:hypothetical protein
MADTMNVIAAHRLTGGTQWSLDWFPIASLIDQDKAVVTDGTNIYFFEFDATSVLAEDVVTHPYKVRPDDFSTAGVWIEQVPYSTGGGSGTVTSVSVTTDNGVSGSVATATTTPAITLTLGAITPTSVNGLTLTSAAVGFTISGGTTSKTLTLSGDATIDGTEIKTTSQVTALSATASGDKDKYLHSNASTGVLEWVTLSITEKWQENATVLSPTTAGNTVTIPLLDLRTTLTDGLVLANTTPSDNVNTKQYSPSVRFTGTSRDTDGGISVETHWRIENKTVNGNTPYGLFTVSYAEGNGSYNDVMNLKYLNPYFGELGVACVRCGEVSSSAISNGKLNLGHSSGAGYYERNTPDAYTTLQINNKNASSTGHILDLKWKSVNRLCITREGDISSPHADGIMFGITAAEKIAFWGLAPMAQPAAIANATGSGGGDAHTQLNLLLAQLRLMGLIAAA